MPDDVVQMNSRTISELRLLKFVLVKQVTKLNIDLNSFIMFLVGFKYMSTVFEPQTLNHPTTA